METDTVRRRSLVKLRGSLTPGGGTVQVRLARDWTDTTGNEHAAGDLVEVDTITLAELEATGVVVPPPSDDEG
jgi:hypothetical protein